MDIIAYRGPTASGGVASTLSRIMERSARTVRLLHLESTEMLLHTAGRPMPQSLGTVDSDILRGHYHYANEFLWPLLHDMPEKTRYSPFQRAHYRQLNLAVAATALNQPVDSEDRPFYINDYQFALVPALLRGTGAATQVITWHVPWPRRVPQKFAEPLAEIARGMLGVNQIFFHTAEYCENFLSFVFQFVKGVSVDWDEMSIRHAGAYRDHVTRVSPRPLGIDVEYWKELADDASDWSRPAKQLVVSVDRADYTKGVLERLDAIGLMLRRNPELAGRVRFVQFVQPCRNGLPAFDSYWESCRQKVTALRNQLGHRADECFEWVDTHRSARELARLYRQASVCLVTPKRDGLNLVCKEFAACNRDGALVLSSGAGAWHELGNYAVPLAEVSPDSIARATEKALRMPVHERRTRASALARVVAGNTLDSWWADTTEPILRNVDQARLFVHSKRNRDPALCIGL